jgi:hypothetical protein
LQIDLINNEIRAAKKSNLHASGKPLRLIASDDPMEGIVETHVSMLEYWQLSDSAPLAGPAAERQR